MDRDKFNINSKTYKHREWEENHKSRYKSKSSKGIDPYLIFILNQQDNKISKLIMPNRLDKKYAETHNYESKADKM